MLRLLLTLCIFATILVDSQKTTQITVRQTFKCNLRKDWRYKIDYYEHDYMPPHDPLHSTGFRDVWGASKVNVDVFNAVGGDGPGDTHYEIHAKVMHTCTNSGIATEFDGQIGSVPVAAPTFQFNLPEFLLDVGI
ncbi:unnamed protein product [Caenorhabditis angaria]|uniref:Uncharacterized protein n=1 Tax=Caenorhabditis angaria TaxID=860376 RepID=A0A9P1I966_9PELO|nr:unnamed protein product [Caenorhabditis angaria]